MIILAFILLLGGAYALYGRLSRDMPPNQLAVQENPVQTDTSSGASASGGETEDAAPERLPAPDFTVYDAEGNEVHLSDFAGTPVILNFWASWCGPCTMEMPDFSDKHAELGGDIQFLMVNVADGSRETVETASDFIAETGYAFPVFYDTENSAASAYGAHPIPLTFFIDADGYVSAYAQGTINAETLQQGIDMIFP